MSDSKLMPVVYYNPAQVTRLTAYADTNVVNLSEKIQKHGLRL